jgi:hypothetical protein
MKLGSKKGLKAPLSATRSIPASLKGIMLIGDKSVGGLPARHTDFPKG